jgi:flagellar hook-associated protein 1 FlgK
MRSTFHGIEVMKRSLFTHQTSLQTVGHNISNANTKGYSRQRVNHVSMFPLEYPSLQRSNLPGQMGQGVEFDSIKRVREQFLDAQFIKEQREYGAWTIRNDTLEKIESIMNEPSDSGIRRVLEKFWNSWQDLSKDPENLSARAVVRETAVAMADSFNLVSRQLNDLESDINTNIEVKVREVNTILGQLANLNEQIFRMELIDQNANDMRDKRDLLIDDLSKIINISVVEDEDGYTVSMGATELVNGNEVIQTVSSESLADAYENGDLRSGEVYGMFYSNQNYTGYYRSQLDAMILSLVQGEFQMTLPKGTVVPPDAGVDAGPGELTEDTIVTIQGINQLHRLGYQLTNPLASGEDLFITNDGSDEINAGNIRVNPSVIANLGAIAASSRTYINSLGEEKVVIGNGVNALHIANIRNARIQFLGGADQSLTLSGNFDDFFRTLVGALGVQAQEAERQELNQKFLVDQVDARRQSVSGVSMDEEMADMIKFQHAYNAAARHMTTYDEMLDKIINGMGQVGR